MENRQYRNCKQPADVGLYCRRCADEIMVKALTSPSGGRSKRVHRPSLATTSAAQTRLIG